MCKAIAVERRDAARAKRMASQLRPDGPPVISFFISAPHEATLLAPKLPFPGCMQLHEPAVSSSYSPSGVFWKQVRKTVPRKFASAPCKYSRWRDDNG